MNPTKAASSPAASSFFPAAVSTDARLAVRADDAAGARVVVLGGGYAGVLAANRLAGRLGRHASITLVEQRADLVHRVRLHEAIARGPGKTYPLSELLHRRVRHVQARAARIDTHARIVETQQGARLPYDQLLVAVGSAPSGAIPGALAHGGALQSPEAAAAAHARLTALGAGERVIVIGGGLSGVETATEIAEHHPLLRVVLVARTILPCVSDAGRAYAASVIESLGIERRDDVAAAIDARGVTFEDGSRLDAGLVVWAGGFAPCGPAIAGELARDHRGRLLIDETLRAVGADRIWIAGDAAASPPGLPFARMGCALAMPMGAHAADNVARAVRGQAPRPFSFGYAGQCISLGRKRALVQRVTPEDRPRGHIISGTMGALLKELICGYVAGSLRVERLVAGAYRWPHTIVARREVVQPGPTSTSMPGAAPGGALATALSAAVSAALSAGEP